MSPPKWDQLGYRPAPNRDYDLLPGFDAPEEPGRVIAQVPRGNQSHVGSVADS